MHDDGYIWTIQSTASDWAWCLRCRDAGHVLVEGRAPSRQVAAALVIRAMVRGLTEPARESLAA